MPPHSSRTIERLRGMLPVFSSSGTSLVYVVRSNADDARWIARHCDLKSRVVGTVFRSREPVHDLHWAPDESRLGFIVGGRDSRLQLIGINGAPAIAVHRRFVRCFAGWSRDGERLAYVASDASEPATEFHRWATLIARIPHARDELVVAPGDGSTAGRTVFSGMRVTFPKWSSRGEKLSFWATYSPNYRCLLDSNGNLRPGDPAVEFDARDGKVNWLAVNAFERLQVGHYYLLKRDYQAAHRWYESATEAPTPQTHANYPRIQRAALFRYHCLRKIGREADAQRKLAEFRDSFAATDTPATAISRYAFAAEVFLSLDACADGRAFLTAELKALTGDADRFGAAVALTQLLLLDGRYSEYCDLASETLFPLFARLRKQTNGDTRPSRVGGDSLATVTAIALLPLCHRKFYRQLRVQRVRQLSTQWQRHAKTDDAEARLFANLVLIGVYRHQGRDTAANAAQRRVENNPAARGLRLQNGVDEFSNRLRQLRVGTAAR